MKNIHLNWSRVKVEEMNRARKPVSGVVAVLVSETLGGLLRPGSQPKP